MKSCETSSQYRRGEILKEDFLKPMGITQYRLAKSIRISASRIHHAVHCKRPINAELALRLARFFGADVQSWVNLQTQYDLECAQIELAARVKKEVMRSRKTEAGLIFCDPNGKSARQCVAWM